MITFVVPCYNEQDNVAAFYDAFVHAFSDADEHPWRIVMVDDGSNDETFARLNEIAELDSRVTVISFSRNFGKEAAVYAGLNEAAESDYVGIIDADLQQPPSIARKMTQILLDDSETDCVAAYQSSRKEGFLLGFAKNQFYKVFARAAHSNSVINNASDFRVFRKDVTQAILSLEEYHRFSKGIFSWIGFKTVAFPYEPEERNAGASKWNVASLIRYAIEGILSFSTRPLHFITMLGLSSSLISFVYMICLIAKTLIVGIDVPGYASTIGFILLFGSIQLLAIGVIGEYLARLYEQDKKRPLYIIRRKINGRDQQKSE